MSGPAAFVTGAPGWLGTNLVQALARGLRGEAEPPAPIPDRPVRCLMQPGVDASVLASFGGRVETVSGDVTDPGSLARFLRGAEGGTLFHCAGIVHPAGRVRPFYAVNVEGTRNLVQAAIASGVRRLVHMSSNSPLGTNPSRDHVFDETSPYHPYMTYGKSKKLAEDLVNAAGQGGRIETVIVRSPWFYGPFQPERQTRFFTMIRTGRVPVVGDGGNRRSMAYVSNICQGMLLAERVEAAAGKTYWIADRRPYTMNEIIKTVEEVLEDDFGIAVAHRRIRVPGLVGHVASILDRVIQGAGLYHQEIHVLSEMNKTIACTIEKARAELGYEPAYDLRAGMRASVRWLLDNHRAI